MQVLKAKYNSVQVVAVKTLHEGRQPTIPAKILLCLLGNPLLAVAVEAASKAACSEWIACQALRNAKRSFKACSTEVRLDPDCFIAFVRWGAL